MSYKSVKVKPPPSKDGGVEEGEGVADEILQTVSKKLLDNDWKPLGRKLGLDEGELDAVDNDHKGDSKEKHHQMLLKWRQKDGRKATEQKLQEALTNINRDDIAQYLSGIHPTGRKVLNENQINELREYLMERYKYLQLPRESLFRDKDLILDELYVDLTMKLKDRFGRSEDGSTFHIEQIFQEIKEKIPKKILIESDPGYGKTTIGLKLVSDWSSGREYIKEKFDLAFNISLSNYNGDLNKLLLNEMKEMDEISEEEKLKIIQWKKEKVLLILDDFDRLTDPQKSELIKMLKLKQPYCKMTAVVTSRTEEMYFQEKDDDSDHLSQNGAKPLKSKIRLYWDKRIQIKGISPENKDEFLLNYLPKDLDISYKKYAYLISNNSKDFYYSPMYLLFFAILVEDRKIENIKNRTDFLIKMFNYFIKRTLLKNKAIHREEEVDVFDLEDTNASRYRSPLYQFGKLALEKLLQNQKFFTKEDVLLCCRDEPNIFDLGFLMKKTKYENHTLVMLGYDTCHVMVLEFLAGFFVSESLRYGSKNMGEFDPLIQSLMTSEILYEPHSFLAPFIVGLMKTDAHIFLSLVDKRFSISHLCNIQLELVYTDENMQSILPFHGPHIFSISLAFLFLNYPFDQSLHRAGFIYFAILYLHYWKKREALGIHLWLLLHPP